MIEVIKTGWTHKLKVFAWNIWSDVTNLIHLKQEAFQRIFFQILKQ